MADKRPSPRELGFYYSLAQVGMEMAAPVAIGVLVDIYGRTAPWGTIVGATLGFAGGLLHLISVIQRQEERSRERKDQE